MKSVARMLDELRAMKIFLHVRSTKHGYEIIQTIYQTKVLKNVETLAELKTYISDLHILESVLHGCK